MQIILLLIITTIISYYLSLKKYWVFDFSYEKSISMNKFICFNFSLFDSTSLLQLGVDSQVEGDHKAIINIRISLFYIFYIGFSINDSRHWDYEKKRFYLKDEEFIQYIQNDLSYFVSNLDKWLLSKNWVKGNNGISDYLEKNSNIIDLETCNDIVTFCYIIEQVCEVEDITKYTLVYEYLN